MQRHWFKRIAYRAIRLMVRLMAVASFRFRSFGSRNMPPEGPVLVCSNHQSHLDPVLVGMVFGRRLNFIARKSLFKFALLRWLIQFLDAIPINRDGMGLEGIKESIRRLRRGEVVLIFPEGTRTTDGELAQLKPGFCALTRRTKAALLPVAIDGAYQAWPRNAKTISFCQIQVFVGEPIHFGDYEQIDDKQLVRELHQRIKTCHLSLRGDHDPLPATSPRQPASSHQAADPRCV
jgi:1-acyl-sn-glycerol-3-phosphate acyltransferase